MSGVIRVGMSGFSFPTWKGEFYPAGTRAGDMLAYYASRFDTVELNTTYYRTPRPEAIEAWRRGSREGFRFAVKAIRWISYTLRPGELSEPFERFMGLVLGLGDALGPILFQAPRGARFDPTRLAALLEVLPAGREYAFEPRHASFRDPEAIAMLRERGVAWCLDDDVDDLSTYPETASFAYLRLRRDTYDDTELAARARIVQKLARKRDVYVFFRHQDAPACVLRAADFRALVS